MRIGFTGTLAGMTKAQLLKFRSLVASHFSNDGSHHEFHHGDCKGSDAEAHDIVAQLPARNLRIIVHPPENPKHRAFKHGNETMKERPYLTRNKRIVENTSIMIATPKGPEYLRSGTWSTIRYARRLERLIHIILPDGTITLEGTKTHERNGNDTNHAEAVR